MQRTARIIAAAALLFASCASAPPAFSADAHVSIKMSTSLPASDPVGQGATRFKQLVEQRSHGTISVQIYPNNQLGGENEVLQQVKQGSIQIAVTAAGTAGNLVPDISVMDAPYVWKDWKHEYRVMTGGGVFAHFAKEFSDTQGLRLLSAMWFYGLRDLTANKPVRKPEDAKGMKIRTPPAPVNLLAGRVLGGEPTPMNYPQVYLALKTGTIDAEENPLPTILSGKLYEVQKYVILTKHIQQSQVVSMNMAFWKGLSKEQQQAVQSAADDAGKYETGLAQKAEAADLKKLQGMPGVTVIAHPDIAAFRARAKQLAPELKSKWGDLYEKITSQQ